MNYVLGPTCDSFAEGTARNLVFTGGHLVTEDDILEALEVFAHYSRKFGRKEIENVVNFSCQIMNGDKETFRNEALQLQIIYN